MLRSVARLAMNWARSRSKRYRAARARSSIEKEASIPATQRGSCPSSGTVGGTGHDRRAAVGVAEVAMARSGSTGPPTRSPRDRALQVGNQALGEPGDVRLLEHRDVVTGHDVDLDPAGRELSPA